MLKDFLTASLATSVVPSCHDLLVVDLSNVDKGSSDILPRTLSAIFQPRVVKFDRCRPSVLHNNMQVGQARVKTSHGSIPQPSRQSVIFPSTKLSTIKGQHVCHPAVSLYPTNPKDHRWPPSLSGCIVPSNYRCASCALQHLSLAHVRQATSFHRCVLLESLEQCHELSMGLIECLFHPYINIIHKYTIYLSYIYVYFYVLVTQILFNPSCEGFPVSISILLSLWPCCFRLQGLRIHASWHVSSTKTLADAPQWNLYT